MKLGIVTLLGVVFLLGTAEVRAQINFPNVEDKNTGWGSCAHCAGGVNNPDVYWMAPFQTSPSLSGNSTEFFISGSKPYSNALFWRKIGPHDSATHYNWDFWVYLDQASLSAHALKYDFFQFVNNRQFMFGSQCNYASGHWDIWNQVTTRWVQTPLVCQKFKPNVWHHIVWQYHRTPDNVMHYDWLAVDGVWRPLNWTMPSDWLPGGWTNNMGVQWQLDTSKGPLAFHQWVDKVNLKIW